VKNGWTGAQYSLFRAALAAAAAIAAASAPAPLGLGVVSLVLSALLGVGYRDRWAALALAGLQAARFQGQAPDAGALLLTGLLVAHAFVPSAPWGSWDARARTDAGHGWALPPALFAAVWVALSLCYAGSAYAALDAERSLLQWAGLAFALVFAPLACVARARPVLWVAGIAVQLAPASLFGLPELGVPIWLLHFLAFDPAWVPPRPLAAPATVFYDGHCGLCHGVVRFLISEDVDGSAFRFAPLDSDAFRSGLPADERAQLPDSVVLRDPAGALLVRWAAVENVAQRLGGIWRAAATALRPVPDAWLDRAYDQVAAHRALVFGREEEACPRLSAELLERFVD